MRRNVITCVSELVEKMMTFLENADALYDGAKIVIDAFERGVFEYGGRPRTYVNYDLETQGLTNKEFQMFKKLFNYANPNMLWNREKYVQLLNDLKIKKRFQDEQIYIKIGIERKRLVNLVNNVEDILDNIREKRDMHVSEIPDLEGKEFAAQRNNLQGQRFKILTPNQMLSRLPISLA